MSGRHHRSRDRQRHGSASKKRSRYRDKTPDGALQHQMQLILARLNALENNGIQPPLPSETASSSRHIMDAAAVSPPALVGAEARGGLAPPPPPQLAGSSSRAQSLGSSVDMEPGATERIVDAIRSINTTVRSNQSFYISNFDPKLHDIDTWCEEVDRAKVINNWSDIECLSRIGNCFKGDARSWLNEWVTSDRSWSNFKKEFKPLCPKKPNVADI